MAFHAQVFGTVEKVDSGGIEVEAQIVRPGVMTTYPSEGRYCAPPDSLQLQSLYLTHRFEFGFAGNLVACMDMLLNLNLM